MTRLKSDIIKAQFPAEKIVEFPCSWDEAEPGITGLSDDERRAALRVMLTTPIMLTAYHPDYGLPNERRLEILRHAARTCVAEAADTYNVSASAIYRWRKDMDTCCPNKHHTTRTAH